MPDLTITPDGEEEPTVWLGDPDDTPTAVLRKCDLATEGRDEVWAAWEAFVGAERVTEWAVQYQDRSPVNFGSSPVSEPAARHTAVEPGLTLLTRTRLVTAWTPAGDQ